MKDTPTEHRACPFCGGQPGPLAHPHRSRHAGHDFAYRACVACGLVFIHPVPSDDLLAAMYGSGDYHDEFYAGDGQGAYAATARRLARHLPPGARVLDFGCGAGHLLAALREQGLDASGVEFGPAAAERAARRSGCKVFDLAGEEWRDGEWDCIHLGDVIEHLATPREVLETCVAALKPGGLLSAEGPLEANPSPVHWAARGFDAIKRWRNPGAVKEFPPYHLVFASVASQRGLFERLPGLVPVAFTLSETGWPYRGNGALRNAVALFAIALARLPGIGRVLGNRFEALYRKAA